MPKQKKRLKNKVVVGHEADGKPIVKWAHGYSKTELSKNVAEIKRLYTTGADVTQRDAVFRVYAQSWYDTFKKPKLKESSRVSYASAMNNYILPHIGDRQLRAISAHDVQAVMNRMEGKGKTLIGDVHSILKHVFAHATAHGVIDRDPAYSLIKAAASTQPRRALTKAEAAAALKVGNEHKHGLLLLLLYYTGMRRGEVLGLQWGDIDFEKNVLHVRRDIDYTTNDVDTVKTENALRTIPITEELMAALKPLRGLPKAFVLQAPKTGSFLPRATYMRWWDDLMAAMLEAAPSIEHKHLRTIKVLTVPRPADRSKWYQPVDIYGSVLTAHYFRHNYASILYEGGVKELVAQKLLGHSDPATTMRIYTHLREAKEEAHNDVVQAAFSGKKQASGKRKVSTKDTKHK